jgi:hypothetical protein
MWTCPRCGREFANRNQWHACGAWTVDDHLRVATPEVAELFGRFVELVERCGHVTLAPTTTRIGFKVRMTFAAVSLRRDRLDAHVILARRLEDPRFVEVVSLGPRSHQHRFRIASPDELDDQVLGWLSEAYAVGRQEHLARAQRGDRPPRSPLPGVGSYPPATRRRGYR